MLDGAHMEMFEARLAIAVYDTRVQFGMAIQVKSLADTVRVARKAIEKAGDVSGRLKASAENMADVFGRVEDMTTQLDVATAELQAALGEQTNGGPAWDEAVDGPAPGSFARSQNTSISPENQMGGGPNAVAAAARLAGEANQS